MSEYTSNLLCHFVGRSKVTEDERFELLITIIKGEQLIANLDNPDHPESFFQIGSHCDHVGEVFDKCDCVCFCDIPNNALAIHTNKYSKFGIGFEKNFIAAQGAHPVMYVPQNYPIVERGDNSADGKSVAPREPKKYFSYMLETAVQLITLMNIGCKNIDLMELENKLEESNLKENLKVFDEQIRKEFFSGEYQPKISEVLQGIGNQMAYIKLYDINLPENHPDNYYMEREWRSLKNINFSLGDIGMIYLPSKRYEGLFLQEFPEYNGEFYILE